MVHPTDLVFPEPIRVSPLIRAARWSALGLGIVYGYIRYGQICRGHAHLREWEAKKFIHKIEEEHVRAEWKSRYETEFLSWVTGTSIEEGKAGFDSEPLYPYQEV